MSAGRRCNLRIRSRRISCSQAPSPHGGAAKSPQRLRSGETVRKLSGAAISRQRLSVEPNCRRSHRRSTEMACRFMVPGPERAWLPSSAGRQGCAVALSERSRRCPRGACNASGKCLRVGDQPRPVISHHGCLPRESSSLWRRSCARSRPPLLSAHARANRGEPPEARFRWLLPEMM